ncbi:MAG: Hsp20/alpha crystallin family protein [Nevskia sp.]|nr:Hsp20/alpha crystallin family protein [Nevskia sp.]
MTTMIHYQPWLLHRGFFNDARRNSARSNASTAANDGSAEWTPAVDIREHADKFVLLVDVPGIDPSSIDVTLEKGVLTLAGARDKAVATEGSEAHRTERASGRFSRRFNLPDTVDADAVSARGNNGVLEIVIPKRPLEQPRKIAVSH